MDRQAFGRRLEDEILILDGAMGSLLQEWGMPHGTAPEAWNLENPAALEDIHRLYVASGADIILTNTFGANRTKLANYGLEEQTGEINEAAVAVARRAAAGKAWVAASVGPLGGSLHPLGDMSFDQAYDAYREQSAALARADVDIVFIETMDDLRMVKAAAIACRDVFAGPIVCSMTFSEDGLTVTGTGPEAAAAVLGDMDVDGVGANCSTGPAELFPVVEKMVQWTDLPVFVEPNAGMPVLRSGKTVFPGSPALLARYATRFASIGVNAVGGCCGTTPKHITAIKKALKGVRPAGRDVPRGTILTGRRRTLVAGDAGPVPFIGERLNPSGRSELRKAAREGRWSVFAQEAHRQAEAGASVLDVNVGMPGLPEAATMVRVLRAVQARVDVPLAVDTAEPDVMEAALKELQGKALVNSVTAEPDKLETVLPLVKKFGAAVVGLALDEQGIPETVEGRVDAARKIVNFALSLGIRRENIVIDPLVMAVSAGEGGATVSLEALSAIREELQVRTAMGVSNISHGLPRRSDVNAHFLLMALSRGLDLPLIDPFDEEVRQALRTADLMLGRDPHARRFLAEAARKKERPSSRRRIHLKGRKPRKTAGEKLKEAVLDGADDRIVDLVKTVLAEGTEPLAVTQTIVVPALEEVGVRFNRKELFLPQMVLSAEAVQKAFTYLKTLFKPGEFASQGKILMATVRGDIHEIGKNIVCAILENHGFEVLDLGKDVSTESLVRAAYEEKPDIIGLSALMTTTMVEMEKTVLRLKKEGLSARLMVGGAVVTRDFADHIGADGYGEDAMDAVRQARALMASD